MYTNPLSEFAGSDQPNTTLFDERFDDICSGYIASFAGAPWFETLSQAEATQRPQKQRGLNGFDAFVIVSPHNDIAGTSWYDTLSIDELATERGDELAERHLALTGVARAVWAREPLVHPGFQRKKIAQELRRDINSTNPANCI